uniref:C2 domain-containing protein n=1 Tax=Syphacia muris TaxID=451379 RepID=A0A0N5AWJ8_9BILA
MDLYLITLDISIFKNVCLKQKESGVAEIEPLEDFPETIFDYEEDGQPGSLKIMTSKTDPETLCRIKLLRPELPPDMQPEGNSELHCAVNIKERVEINGERRLVQNRKTTNPEWDKCWDTGVVPGRVLQVILMNGTVPIADATMRQQFA